MRKGDAKVQGRIKEKGGDLLHVYRKSMLTVGLARPSKEESICGLLRVSLHAVLMAW